MTRYIFFLLSIILLSACTRSGPGNGPTPVVPTVDSSGDPAGDPLVLRYSMNSGNVGDTIWIIGKNFSKTAKNNQITFSTASSVAIQSKVAQGTTNDSLQVIVPQGATSDVLKVGVSSKTAIGKDSFWITTGKWIRMADCPSGGRYNGAAFGVDGKGYLGLGVGDGGTELNDLWEFDPLLNKWTKKDNFPVSSLQGCMSFVIGDTAYVGLGSSVGAANYTLYAYDPSKDSWLRKTDEPYMSTVDVAGLAAAGKGYITSGYYTTSFWSYDPASNAWILINNFPVPKRFMASGFVINDEFYIGGGNSQDKLVASDLWKYSPSSDKWTQLVNAFSGGYPSAGFSLNGKGYRLISGSGAPKGSGFYQYDPATNKWSMEKAFPGSAYDYEMSFTTSNRAFIACGMVPSALGTVAFSAETWEFVP